MNSPALSPERIGYLKKYYTDIRLRPDTCALYVVRTSIFQAIRNSSRHFRGRVVDLGCGEMPYRSHVLSIPEVEQYIGIDLKGDKVIDRQYSGNAIDLEWDGNTIPMPADSVDSVILTEVLEHCAHPEQVLKEIYRVLKPGGRLFLTVPFIWPLHKTPYDEYRYTPYSLARHLRNCGYTDAEIRPLGGWDAALAQMIGTWAMYHPTRSKILSFLIRSVSCGIIRILLWREARKKPGMAHHDMITGLSAIALKPFPAAV